MSVPIPDETIMGLIATSPQHGYQILTHFKDQKKLGWVWKMSSSQVYAVLNRLEKKSLILGSKVVQKDAPAKIEYSITPLGNKQMLKWLFDSSPSASIRWVRVTLSSKLYIAFLLDLPTNEIIEFQKMSLEKRLILIEEKYKGEDSRMETLLSTFIIGQLQAAIKWLNELSNQTN